MNTNTNWKYTAAEKRAIHDAYDAIAYAMDAAGHREPIRLREATNRERRCRSCMTAAKAMLVIGFAEGMRENPPASTLASYSEGIATAVILGADYGRRLAGTVGGRRDSSTAGSERMLPLLVAAATAHGDYICRGLEANRAARTA